MVGHMSLAQLSILTRHSADLADTCAEFVANNPDAFEQAHWKIRSLRVWSE